MASLTDLFNPSFFMFLGILLLVVALLVVYFESKMREQNHKIASMLSLVSTLADDLNGVKFGLNHLVMRGGTDFSQTPIVYKENLGNNSSKVLIEVSDDDGSDDEDIEDESSDDEASSGLDLIENTDNDDDDNDTSSDVESIYEKDNIKILKLNISNEEQNNENNDFDLEETVDLECDDFVPIDELPEIDDDYVEEVLDLKYDNVEVIKEQKLEDEYKNEELNITSSDLKTISINLGEESNIQEETIDYKKLQLPKLRSIVVEKGIASNTEVSKLKKQELLKLLGVE